MYALYFTTVNNMYIKYSFIYLFQTTEVHRHTHKTYNIYREKEHTNRDRHILPQYISSAIDADSWVYHCQ